MMKASSTSAVAMLIVGAVMGMMGSAAAADTSKAVTPAAKDQAAMEAALSAQEKAWNAGDMDAFFKPYWKSADVSYSGGDGVLKGFDAVLARFKKKYGTADTRGQLRFSDLEYQSLGPDAALVLGQFHLTRKVGDANGYFSLVFKRFPEGWRIIHDHTTGAAKPAG